MKNKSLFHILLVVLISSLAFDMAHPVTPMLINKLNLPAYMFGIFFATMAIGNFIGSPLFGNLSDKYGRVKFLIIGAIGYGLGQLGFGFNSNPIIIVLFRFFGGFFVVSFLTVSLAYVTDLSNDENRIKYMTYYAATTTLGSAIGSLLGGVIGNNNYKITFFTQFLICMVVGLLAFLLLSETVNPNTIDEVKAKKINVDYKQYLNKTLIIMLFVVLAFYFASTSYSSSINYYIESVLNLSPSFIGGFISVTGIIGFVVNLFVTPILAKHFKELNVFKVITIALSISLALMVAAKNTYLFLGFAIIFTAFTNIHIPLQQSIITKLSNGNYGSLIGILNSFKAVGQVSGSLSAGFIFSLNNKFPFLLGSLIVLIGFLFLLTLKPIDKNHSEEF